ncbi:serine acetyltransferase [Bacteroidia bacterium]|nr:serine acetyltransferase [Bacteroidia bacterium]
MNQSKKVIKAIERLTQYESFDKVYHQSVAGQLMPSVKALHEIVLLARAILFPGYFGELNTQKEVIPHQIRADVIKLHSLLTDQIQAGLFFYCPEHTSCDDVRQQAREKAADFIDALPKIRELLITDVEAMYNGDPAATTYGEIIFCYPAIRAISNYRIAHELLLLGVPLIPRIITEMAHSETGIDIHPGAKIGTHFAIDHGTGIVIGETCIIGNHVQLYQGVTLGAKSFPLDDNGVPIKGILRHPIIEDNVVIYANATILGRIIIGENSVIGGNMWITKDIPSGTKEGPGRIKDIPKGSEVYMFNI